MWMFTMANNKLLILKISMHNMMAVRLWMTCYSLIIIFSNKTIFCKKIFKIQMA